MEHTLTVTAKLLPHSGSQNEANEEPITSGSDDESPSKSLISSTPPGLNVTDSRGGVGGHIMENPHNLVTRLLAALFYGVASFLIMVVNKNVLTTQRFPSFQVLGLGQMVATISVLFIGRLFRIVTFPTFSPDIFRKIWPLPLFYIGNMIFGLGGTKELSLPMMTVLRRFSILMTMMGECYVLKNRPRMSVQISVYIMIFGAMVAACNDLAFNFKGYVYILLNDICTAAQGVYMKKKLDAKDLGKYGLMFYNAIFMFIPAVLIAFNTGEFEKVTDYPGLHDPFFIFMFTLSSVFGFILIFATVCCTQYNSALTTSIVGCLKNVLITYSGMVIGGDYVFSMWNFMGLNISIMGSLLYTGVTFSSKSSPKLTAASAKSTTVV
ncbi:UDP-N-acetylglucosamine/UDP-glucose/GDP-mannose transporter-like isoform X2 [Tigriopus californicus]|uniref:UDP-N-acetylglucosamine/UDP-glucose/GDP-mannose transporter-like isoform X2 n=1 Tax=Tigriopus californicus TaxID=6832 RepID=UPI0027DA62C1|nr:UDP-N-acetylglucosamine/UDP-glucose/GDP-mannose transporter-like isoform X2 [Tigriopus californicus]XP_059097237.1 UDP-N-acetylglucosamine/UDP-glucose/GDP-mannose transporter-like isoform X2 [Tigriopus californicus]